MKDEIWLKNKEMKVRRGLAKLDKKIKETLKVMDYCVQKDMGEIYQSFGSKWNKMEREKDQLIGQYKLLRDIFGRKS